MSVELLFVDRYHGETRLTYHNVTLRSGELPEHWRLPVETPFSELATFRAAIEGLDDPVPAFEAWLYVRRDCFNQLEEVWRMLAPVYVESRMPARWDAELSQAQQDQLAGYIARWSARAHLDWRNNTFLLPDESRMERAWRKRAEIKTTTLAYYALRVWDAALARFEPALHRIERERMRDWRG